MKFSVGLQHQRPEFISFIEKNKAHIREIYFSWADFPNGRTSQLTGEETPWQLMQLELEENTRLLTGNKTVYLNNATEIPLSDGFFNNGPMLFDGMCAQTVTLRSGKSGRFVEMGIEGFTHLCLWGVPTKMSLIAVEPWIGTSDRTDTDHIWEKKPGIQTVAPGSSRTHRLTFRVG